MTGAGNPGQLPVTTDPRVPLSNLAAIRTRLDSLSRFLHDSVASNTPLPAHHLDSVNFVLGSAIHELIANASALVSILPGDDDPEIVEVGAEELLAEHVHVCGVCGKGFKRDANLRMHMRAHGDQYKTPQALSKPPVGPHVHAHLQQPVGSYTAGSNNRTTRTNRVFSCPYVGCNRNKDHVSFRPLKSVTCVKNHFKRTHCPKMYGCTGCNDKRFSVMCDLRSHMKTCGEKTRTTTKKWMCCCGTSFTRKDKLFAHIALFEGHMPAIIQPSPLPPQHVEAAVMAEDEDEDEDEEDEVVDFLDSTASGSRPNGEFSNGCSFLDNDVFGYFN